MSIARFPNFLAVTEYTDNRKGSYRDRFDIVDDPNRPELLTETSDGDAVGIYKLIRVDTYRTAARLEQD